MAKRSGAKRGGGAKAQTKPGGRSGIRAQSRQKFGSKPRRGGYRG